LSETLTQLYLEDGSLLQTGIGTLAESIKVKPTSVEKPWEMFLESIYRSEAYGFFFFLEYLSFTRFNIFKLKHLYEILKDLREFGRLQMDDYCKFIVIKINRYLEELEEKMKSLDYKHLTEHPSEIIEVDKIRTFAKTLMVDIPEMRKVYQLSNKILSQYCESKISALIEESEEKGPHVVSEEEVEKLLKWRFLKYRIKNGHYESLSMLENKEYPRYREELSKFLDRFVGGLRKSIGNPFKLTK